MLNRRFCVMLILLLLGTVSSGHAAAPPGKSADDAWNWVQARLHTGDEADLDVFCGAKVIVPINEFADEAKPGQVKYNDANWQMDCRAISSKRLRALLTRADNQDDFPHGIRLSHAHIIEDLDLEDTHILAKEFWLDDSLIDGDVDLSEATVDGVLSLDGTTIKGALAASGLHIVSVLDIRDGAKIRHGINLLNARMDGQVSLRNGEFGGDVDMANCRFGNFLSMDDAKFDGDLDMLDSEVKGQISVDHAVFLPPKSKDAADRHWSAENLSVGGEFLAREATLPPYVSLIGARIHGSIDLRDSRVTQIEMVGAQVDGDFRLAGDNMSVKWVKSANATPDLDLRNARVGNLQDDEGSWPPDAHIGLEGFTFDHLGGLGATTHQDPNTRDMGWWKGWLQRDPQFSTQPYTHLSNMFLSRGDRDRSAMILFYGRDRERLEAGSSCAFLRFLDLAPNPATPAEAGAPVPACRWGEWLILSTLQAAVGYGIGDYTFRALIWIIGLAVTGTAILAFAPGVRGTHFALHGRRGPRRRTLVWCFGASLSHILPVVSLSPEFSDFFNDPTRKRLHAWQHVAFAVLVVLGWILGLFVLAAFSGITQK